MRFKIMIESRPANDLINRIGLVGSGIWEVGNTIGRKKSPFQQLRTKDLGLLIQADARCVDYPFIKTSSHLT